MATPATPRPNDLPTIALVGRVNVGKSSLFNRLIEEHKAIVSTFPGTTRTNNEGQIVWRGLNVRIIDTGGLTFGDQPLFSEEIQQQAERAVEEADIVVFVIDGQTELIREDIAMAQFLRRQKKQTMLIANKIDTEEEETELNDIAWQKLGFGTPFPVSAINGRNTGNLLDIIYEQLLQGKKIPAEFLKTTDTIHISIIGKPNVGKSSLFNKLIGEDKVIVSPIPHTTREPHDTEMIYETDLPDGTTAKQSITFVDTAGIRRKAKVDGQLERQGIQKSIESIDGSDIVLFVIDGSEPLSHQDMQLGGLLEQHLKSVLIIINKWDLATDNSDAKRNEVKEMMNSYFPHLNFAPMIFVSGLTGYRVHQLFPIIMQAWEARHTVVPADELDEFIKKATTDHRPTKGKGTRHPELRGFVQIDTNPPIFKMYIKHRTSIHISYVHYIENKLREKFNFFATPIMMKLTKMKR